MLSPEIVRVSLTIRRRKQLSKLTNMVEKGDKHKTWIYILPKRSKSRSYSPIQSIPLLTKQIKSNNYLKKAKTRKQ